MPTMVRRMFDHTTAREARIAAGIDATRAAAAIGVSLSTLSRYERGEGEPSFSQGMALARLLECEPSALLAAVPA